MPFLSALAKCAHATWSGADLASHAADGTWGKWRLETKNGENGVHWVEAFKPIYLAGSAGKKVFSVASGIVGKVRPAVRIMVSHIAMSGESKTVASDVHEETFCLWTFSRGSSTGLCWWQALASVCRSIHSITASMAANDSA